MLAYFQKSGQLLLDFVYPPRCINCKNYENWLCKDCFSQIDFISPPVCRHCGTPVTDSGCRECANNPLAFVDGIRSAAYFEDNPIRPAIHALKYRDHKAAGAVLGKLLLNAYQQFQFYADIIVPVPLHTLRFKERGYNQSDLLAKELAAGLNLPVDTTALKRVRATKSQMTLGINERHQNVKNAFVCTSTKLVGKNILLIDDVCTTGSTLDACAAPLKARGAASVWGLTLARAR